MSAASTVTSEMPVRLVDYAKAHLVVVPVDEVGGLIAAGAIRIAGRVGRMAELVQRGDVLSVEPTTLARCALVPEDVPLVIVHEDADLLVCEKPSRVHVHPIGPHLAGTLLIALLWTCGARPDAPWQTVGTVFFAHVFVYRSMGKDFEAATTAGGVIGFGLSSFAVAMATVKQVERNFGPAPKSFLLTTLVGGAVSNVAHALVIMGFYQWLVGG